MSNIISGLKNRFQKSIRNIISLGNDSTLESDLKPVKIGDKVTPLEISETGVNISGTLKVDNVSVQTGDEVGAITALNNATENELVTVGATTTELEAEAKLLFDGTTLKVGTSINITEKAAAEADVAGDGQLWVKSDAPNNLYFTDDVGNDILISRPLHTAVWGGGFPRSTGHDGNWLGIPTGHMGANAFFGTTASAPDTSYTVSTTADDLCGVIWRSYHGIEVTGVNFNFAQGGATNTKHNLCLMRYDIDADGDLSNGVEVCAVIVNLTSADYTHLLLSTGVLTSDVEVTSSQVLIGMIYCPDGINAALTAKCILEYKESII